MNSLYNNDFTTRANTVLSFTALGFGGGEIGNMGYIIDAAQARDTIRAAWDAGLRYFDTAPLYGMGLSERRIGDALAGEERSSYIVSSKVGLLLPPDADPAEDENLIDSGPARGAFYDYSYDGVMRSVEASLCRLGMTKIDILNVHDIDMITHRSAEILDAHVRALTDGGGWRALEELRSSGAVTAIGAGLNQWEMCERLLQLVDPDIFLLAGRYTLLEQESLETLLPACVAKGVAIVIGGPFNSGILATGAIENASYNYAPAPEWVRERVIAMEQICLRYGASLAQVALQFPLGHPAVVSVIPGCVTADEVRRNVDTLNFPVPQDLWTELAAKGYVRSDSPFPQGA